MQTHSFSPLPPLSFFIEVSWFSEAGNFDYANLTLPMLHHEMVINFSDHFEVSNGKTCLINDQTGWISGLQTRPIRTATGGKHFTVGVLFKPWGLYALTGIDAFELQDQHITLEDIFGAEAQQLTEKIFHQSTPALILSVLEDFLVKKLSGRTIPAYLLHSLQLMQYEQPAKGLINRIAEKLNISSKAYIQAFKKYIGITPGKFHHLLLLNQLLHKLINNPSQKLTEVGYELNFFDQAHFIHFFKKYTGFTPSAYVHQYKEGKINPAIPHSIEIALQ